MKYRPGTDYQSMSMTIREPVTPEPVDTLAYGRISHTGEYYVAARLERCCPKCGQQFLAGHVATAVFKPSVTVKFSHTDCDDPCLDEESN
jgi:hypothetical protein